MKAEAKAMGMIVALVALAALLLPAGAQAGEAGEEVALVVQLRGKALVERGGNTPFSAVIKSPIELKDVIETLRKSRAKMLFTDESIMTLGPESRASVETFVKGIDEQKGATVFNLMSGQMRTVVGKSSFEVHTPTVVAAARGTVIEFTVAEVNGVTMTIVACHEGTVQLMSTDPSQEGVLYLTAGNVVIINEGDNPALLTPQPTAGFEGPLPGAAIVTSIETEAIDSIHTPSVVITPPVEAPAGERTTPVVVDVVFPGDTRQM